MGWMHIATGAVGSDILVNMSMAPLTPGFQRPVPAGDYTFLIQDTDNVMSYSLRFQISSAVAGDFNGDSMVNGADLSHWAGDFGVNDHSDADNDGDSDGADFLAWERQAGQGGFVAAVPEPAGAALVVQALVLAGSWQAIAYARHKAARSWSSTVRSGGWPARAGLTAWPCDG